MRSNLCRVCCAVLDNGYKDVGLCHRHIDMVEDFNVASSRFEDVDTMNSVRYNEIPLDSFPFQGDYDD